MGSSASIVLTLVSFDHIQSGYMHEHDSKTSPNLGCPNKLRNGEYHTVNWTFRSMGLRLSNWLIWREASWWLYCVVWTVPCSHSWWLHSIHGRDGCDSCPSYSWCLEDQNFKSLHPWFIELWNQVLEKDGKKTNKQKLQKVGKLRGHLDALFKIYSLKKPKKFDW